MSQRPAEAFSGSGSGGTTVGILTWNDSDEACRAIDSVIRTARGVPLIVLDNGSAPPFEPGSCDRVRLIRSESNLGVAVGRNRVVEAATSEFVCLLDSDAQLLDGCLSALGAALMSDPRVAVAAPVFRGADPTESAGRAPSVARKLARACRLTRRYARCPQQAGAPREVEFAIGACHLVRRSAFQEVGGYDESIFFGPEDLDLCERLRRQGWKVVQVDTAIAIHQPRRAHRNLVTRRGRRHARAVLSYYWRRWFTA